MSRVGNKIINVPEGVTVEVASDNTVTVKGDGRGGQAALGDMRIEQHGELKQGTTPSQPFNDALGTDYPYPEIPGLGHRGDWFTP